MGELMELIAGRFAPLLTVVEFEGDAVYARADAAAIPRGEILLELLESTYVLFRDRVEAIKRHTTCGCNACRLIPTLDLKFIVHFGEYVLIVTHEITPLLSGSRLSARMKILGPGPDVMKRMMARITLSRHHIADNYRRLAQLVIA